MLHGKKVNPHLFLTGNYWDHIGNRRAYLESFAALSGFDPLVADNWCKITAEELLNHKVGGSEKLPKRERKRTTIIKLFCSTAHLFSAFMTKTM
jgi:hypothetical protein